MKHIFIIHSHTLFLSSLGVINKLGLKEEEVLFLFHRHYKTIIPFNYKWIDISEEFEKTYYILFSWSRRHFRLDKKQRKRSIDFFDKLVEDNAPNGYYLYTSHLQAFAYQILATNSKCEECFFVQEGGRAMISCMTSKIAPIWRLYNKIVMRGDNRLWKCTNWFPNENTPYNKPITVYTFDDKYFGDAPARSIHIDWPKIDVDVEINVSYPIFVIDGDAELGHVERGIYEKALQKLVDEYAKENNYIKFHPMQSAETKEKYKGYFICKGVHVEELPMDIPFELIVLKYEKLKVYGFGTSLLFYAKAFGHDAHSNESDLMVSRRYRLYASGLEKL